MKRFMLMFSIVLTSISLLAVNAEAKRMGGGGSVGKQRTMAPQQTQAAPAATNAAAPAAAAAPASTGSKWMGPLAGLAIGAGLGAMFAGGLGGLGGGFGGILMMLALAALAFFLFTKFRKSQQPAMQYAGNNTAYTPPAVTPSFPGGASISAPAASNIPADFPVDAFLRSAKMSFIRLQAANDRKDLNDLREYTTPEMFAEISMQLQERDNAPQTTDVLNVNAALLEVVTENNHAIASVRLSGQLSENKHAAENFDEIWHVQKNLNDDKAVWLLAGIQQVA